MKISLMNRTCSHRGARVVAVRAMSAMELPSSVSKVHCVFGMMRYDYYLIF